MKTEPNDLVCPLKETQTYCDSAGENEETITHIDGGLTKREYFAAMAMQGLLSNAALMALPEITHVDLNKRILVIKLSVRMADALIAELNK